MKDLQFVWRETGNVFKHFSRALYYWKPNAFLAE